RKAADYSVWDAVSILAEVVKIGAESAVDHCSKIRRRIVAVIKFLNRNDVGLQTLKNPKRKGLVRLRVPIEVGRHQAHCHVRDLRVQIRKREKGGENSAQTARNIKRTSHSDWQGIVAETFANINVRNFAFAILPSRSEAERQYPRPGWSVARLIQDGLG